MDAVTLKLQAEPLILMALREDMPNEDISTVSVTDGHEVGEVRLVAKEEGILCGLDVFERTFQLLDPTAHLDVAVVDGERVVPGQDLGCVCAHVAALLSAERVALNYLQRMSGIATATRRMSSLLEGTGIRLADTRKTIPNMRVFEKEAVRVGGGINHRQNLSDAVMLKDNHIDAAGGIAPAIAAARARASFVCKIEVEVERIEQVYEAVAAGADIIMLDNMDHERMREAIAIIDGRALVEVSGNVTPQYLSHLTDLGVDIISSGALTHSAAILDLSLKHLVVMGRD